MTGGSGAGYSRNPLKSGPSPPAGSKSKNDPLECLHLKCILMFLRKAVLMVEDFHLKGGTEGLIMQAFCYLGFGWNKY